MSTPLPITYPAPVVDPTIPTPSATAIANLVAQLQAVPTVVGGSGDNLPPFLQKILAIARGDVASPGSPPVVGTNPPALVFTTGAVVLAILADYFDLNDAGTANQLRKEAAILSLVKSTSGV